MASVSWTSDLSVGVASLDAQHQTLFRMFDDLGEAILEGKAGVPARALELMSAWLREHICGTDKKYTAHLNSRGIK